MKILVLDTDHTRGEHICSSLEMQGHSAQLATNWQDAIGFLQKDRFPMVLLDKQVLDAKAQNISAMRRSSLGYIYTIVMCDEDFDESASDIGSNAYVVGNINLDTIEKAVNTASDFVMRSKQLSNDAEDFPSAGGVISKSAFYQLFLSAMQRAGRYNELEFVLFIAIDNYKNILVEDGEYSANHATARLAHHLAQTRRQSDILAQTGHHEYAILFLRPDDKDEPIEATRRFANTLSTIRDYTTGLSDVNVTLKLQTLPSGDIIDEHTFSVSGQN